jgi:hypothetical protein
MLAIAIVTAVGGLLTIGFAYWSMNKTVVAPVKAVVNPITAAGDAVAATARRVEQATEATAKNPSEANERNLTAANNAHGEAAKAFASVAPGAIIKEASEGLANVFQNLGSLSPPIAALCVALLMFLAAGGIEFAGLVK